MIIKRTMIFLLAVTLLATSCKTTFYNGYVGQGVVTNVTLSKANFQVLGSFVGTVTTKKRVIGIKQRTGLISDAKQALINNAKQAGVELKGSRTLVNVTTDFVQNRRRINCTVSAEIIEFNN